VLGIAAGIAMSLELQNMNVIIPGAERQAQVVLGLLSSSSTASGFRL
jgi:hypothetical protein